MRTIDQINRDIREHEKMLGQSCGMRMIAEGLQSLKRELERAEVAASARYKCGHCGEKTQSGVTSWCRGCGKPSGYFCCECKRKKVDDGQTCSHQCYHMSQINSYR